MMEIRSRETPQEFPDELKNLKTQRFSVFSELSDLPVFNRAGATILLCLALGGCARTSEGREAAVELRVWAMGGEGEVLQQLVPEFERRNPGIRVRVQQVPWTAAHEKLLTSYVGESTPDVSQLGNTWIPEFAALGALEPLDRLVATDSTVPRGDFFPGIWATNVINDTTFGIPWYVDTRVLFYRSDLLARAGFPKPPTSVEAWVDMMRKVKALGGSTKWAILLPLDEWAQPVIFGLQKGSPILADGGRSGAFTAPPFRSAFDFYVSLFHEQLAPTFANTQVANLYQDFTAGTFAMYITGPWNLGEFRKRLPDSLQTRWATAPLPGPGGLGNGASIAGGSSLVVWRASPHKAESWKFVQYLSEPAQQVKFYHLTGDLPPRRAAWSDTAFTKDARIHAFYEQLQRVEPLPKVPEWELIATRIAAASEAAARGRATNDEALASLQRDVDQILEKRRWMLARQTASR